MQIDDVRIIMALAEAKSLSQAASNLYMSRPSLTQKIDSLESRYGVVLYNRTPTGVVPTAAGDILTRFAKNVSLMEDKMASEMAATKEMFPSTIVVGMSYADGVAILPKLVAQFNKVSPESRIHLDAGYEPELVEKLRQGKLDFAILENQPIENDISYETLGQKQLLYLAPNKAPYNNTLQPVKIETLLTWPMIVFEWDSGVHMVGNRLYRERHGVSLSDHFVIAQFDSHEAKVNGVKEGLGWASLPEVIVDKYKNDPDVIPFKVDTGPLWYPVDLAWRTDFALSEEATRFKDFILANAPEGYFRHGKSNS